MLRTKVQGNKQKPKRVMGKIWVAMTEDKSEFNKMAAVSAQAATFELSSEDKSELRQ